ncbi:MAG TPA: isoprenylcysteine carboxylmethyltransferase family protein [Bacteriovoracaceae bacterium]|nr:isoprenylcysteine carboxylmethyltransferase family protein [Bacteriovoracaceae bacterium]
MLFYVMILFFILQRVSEIVVGKRNMRNLQNEFLIRPPQLETQQMIILHAGWFVALIGEFYFLGEEIGTGFFIAGIITLALCQLVRFITMYQIGRDWVPMPVALPNQKIVSSGLFHYIRHPNYLVVMIEIILLPLLGKCYVTAFFFGLLNIFFLLRRIRIEEDALNMIPEYAKVFSMKKKLIPFLYNLMP